MRKISVTLLITLLAASCFSILIGQAIAQSSDSTNPLTTPPPLTIRWMRYQGVVTAWGSESYKGSITVNAKTANAPLSVFKPWVTVNAFWSNQPPFPETKPTGEGQYSLTNYNARLVMLLSIRKQDDFIVNVTGLWNINKVKITTEFDQNGAPINTIKEITPIAVQATGQLLITSDWKQFTLKVDGVDALKGVQISMVTSTNPMSPFSNSAGLAPNLGDLKNIMGCFRAIPGFSNYNPDLDYNHNSQIDLSDLTTVAANM